LTLFKIPTVGVPGRVIRQKPKDKDTDKKGNDNVNNNFERDHGAISRGYQTAASLPKGRQDRSHHHTDLLFPFC
jgi:hypothetical protein